MKKLNKILALLFIFAMLPMTVLAKSGETDESVRKERKHIRKGNNLYYGQRFADAEVEYKKALSENPNSYLGSYNLAMSLLMQSAGSNSEDANNPLNTAVELLNKVATGSKDASLRSKAYYNLGNIAFYQQQYDQSIELYKNALRQNPDDNQARENLRLAQLKKKEQEQNKDNKNKDEKNDKDKQQEKQEKQQDKKDEQDKNEDKKDEQKQQPQQQQSLSKENMEQILKTMQNQEKATQEKVKAQQPQNVRKTGNQW